MIVEHISVPGHPMTALCGKKASHKREFHRPHQSMGAAHEKDVFYWCGSACHGEYCAACRKVADRMGMGF